MNSRSYIIIVAIEAMGKNKVRFFFFFFAVETLKTMGKINIRYIRLFCPQSYDG